MPDANHSLPDQQNVSEAATRQMSPATVRGESTVDVIPDAPGTDSSLNTTRLQGQKESTKLVWPRPVAGRIDMYELLEEQRPGGMARVFKARHAALGKIVALKAMRTDLMQSESARLRFEREAKAVSLLEHPNIIRILHYSADTDPCFFTMPFLAEGSLASHLKHYQGNPRAAVQLMEKVARGVDCAHRAGLFHRDLKPGNILLDELGEPIVSDFGLAKFRDEDLELTRPGEMLGTAPYMPPEQAAGDLEAIGAPSDVWSLGVITYELLTAKRPFEAKSSDQLRWRIIQEQPIRLSRVVPRIDRSLEAIVLKCLEKSPKDRYASAGELADDLKNWLENRTTKAQPEGWLKRGRRVVRRHLVITAAVLTAALAIGVAGAIAYYRDPQRSLDAIDRAIARGQDVSLIGTDRRPTWSRWAGKEGAISTQNIAGEEVLTVSAQDGVGLLELLPAVSTESFRFAADVCHVDRDSDGDIGIYFGRSRFGPMDALCSLTFDDVGKRWSQQAGSELRPNLALVDIRFVDPFAVVRKWNCGHTSFQAAYQGKKAWRTLAVRATTESIVCSWDNQPFFETTTAKLSTDETGLLDVTAPIPGLPPLDRRGVRFNPCQGLGLCVFRSTAAFRNVTLAPLPGNR